MTFPTQYSLSGIFLGDTVRPVTLGGRIWLKNHK